MSQNSRSLGMVCNERSPHSEFPCLSSSSAEARDFVPVVLGLILELGSQGSEWKHMRLCTEACQTIRKVMTEAGPIPTREQPPELRDATTWCGCLCECECVCVCACVLATAAPQPTGGGSTETQERLSNYEHSKGASGEAAGWTEPTWGRGSERRV